ncbi:PP2C family protein-serine/threonine phosphatase [Chondrinema litorale]|uniref:PP2C family protein-serine/threonine phosphatase n=1 Tax=Chondrinema litorale TaxID=2994555 RepID=UPI002543A101|nr:SpoIIE family protein phosphatase [Chondrinema litorale]UZR97423.1 SpoIIE family protein phosphatase [Chondrinema litorale]
MNTAINFSHILGKLSIIGVLPAEDRAVRNSKNMMVYMGMLMSCGGILWGSLLLFLELYRQSYIPYGYVVITFFNLLYFNYSKKFDFARNIQIFISLMLPFALQWTLGGYLSSGIVMLWSLISLFVTSVIKRGEGDFWWFIIFLGLCFLSYFIEPYLAYLRPETLNHNVSTLLALINISCITIIIFYLSKMFLKKNQFLTDSNGQLRKTQKQLFQQSKMLEQSNFELLRYQRRINESINAAQTIQQAFLPDQLTLQSTFEEHFILYKPKDIVSGDFYWMHKFGKKTIFIEADCTGHGVPGAFMTLIGNAVFNQIVKIEQEYDPASIMYKVDSYLKSILQQELTNNRDGMDVSVLVIDEKEDELDIVFGGSYQRMDYYLDGHLHTVRGSRKRIGGIENPNKKFESSHLTLPKDAVIYLYSDGLIDQNDPEGKRYGSERFSKILSCVADLPLKQQKVIISNSLKKHQQNMEQRDDITIIGLKYAKSSVLTAS